MLYANDETLNSGYATNLDKLNKNKSWTSKVIKTLNKHKFITTVAMLFIFCCIMNCVLIYTFMQLLKNI